MISLKAVRSAGAPLVVVETADMMQTMLTCIKETNGHPAIRWDVCNGLRGLNPEGNAVAGTCGGDTMLDPSTMLTKVEQVVAGTGEQVKFSIFFMMNAHRFWNTEVCVQAIWNVRDTFKEHGCTLVMMVPSGSQLPIELKSDCVTEEDTLPTTEELDAVVGDTLKGAKVPALETNDRMIDTLLGLSSFGAEQAIALSIRQRGKGSDAERYVDMDSMWETKRKMVEQTDGLKIWRGGERFADIEGEDNAKAFVGDICSGEDAPRAIVFVDEIEKGLAAAQTDTSGTTQDQHQLILTHMQNKRSLGILFFGVAGSGKSLLAKAAGNEAGIPTIQLDLGALKGSLVGESETKGRAAIKVIEAVSQGRALWLATCNSTQGFSPELKRRFSLGTFFFDVPSDEANAKLWKMFMKRRGLAKQTIPDSRGWTGAEIENCCNIAWRTRTTLVKASKFIVPVSIAAADRLQRMREEAHGKYIDAEREGFYVYEKNNKTLTKSTRLTT